MADTKSTITNGFEELLTKSIEANKIFINEGSQFFKQFSSKDNAAQNFDFLKNEAVKNTFNEYVKLNVNHFNKLIDLGLSFVKNFNTNQPSPEQPANDAVDAPSFVLASTTKQGQKVNFRFLLDNVKPDVVNCQFINSAYTLQSTPTNAINFATKFTPQAFDLNAGESKTVAIEIDVPQNTAVGLYTSKVQVKGFEPTYFSIEITVTEAEKKPTTNARKTTTKRKK
jgi:hypothetical protein